ncbi:unnamed protein product, partial [Prorocentrum cordatum]
MIQAGGAHRDIGVNALRNSMAAAGGPSEFLRYCVHPANKVEHHFRVFDAASRCHFVGAQHYAQSERHSLVCHVARRVLLVDPAPAFSDALDAGLAAHGGDRPRAYKPWGRGLPAGDAAAVGQEARDTDNDADGDLDENGVDYHSRRAVVKARSLQLLETRPAARGPSAVSYTAPSLQHLAAVRAFYMAGTGCLVRGDMGAIAAFEKAAKANGTFKKQCASLNMRCTFLDM